jgi:hypothetical protein
VNVKGKTRLRAMLLIMSVLTLATPVFAQVRDPTLSDFQAPGSVIVFPKFIKGTVNLPEGGLAPRSELEIAIVCPKAITCSENQQAKIRFHWVCGTNETNLAGSFVCDETDFDVTAAVFEKIVLVPDGSFPGVSTKTVPGADCPGGYLIGWVVSPDNDMPIKFDGLLGDASLRQSGATLASYPAIPIQADPALATGATITTNLNGALLFDGGAGHYQAISGRVLGDVRYTTALSTPGVTTLTRGALTLLTLDVKSNRPNNPVFVDLNFFGGKPSAIGNGNALSTSTEFICWGQIALTNIDQNLTTAVMGRKGVFVSGTAQKVGLFGIPDKTGPVSLLGLVESREGDPTTFPTRETIYTLYNDSVPVSARFRPTPSPGVL